MKNFVITEQLAQAIADYLVTRPYREVAGMVQGLHNLSTLPDVKPEPAAVVVKPTTVKPSK